MWELPGDDCQRATAAHTSDVAQNTVVPESSEVVEVADNKAPTNVATLDKVTVVLTQAQHRLLVEMTAVGEGVSRHYFKHACYKLEKAQHSASKYLDDMKKDVQSQHTGPSLYCVEQVREGTNILFRGHFGEPATRQGDTSLPWVRNVSRGVRKWITEWRGNMDDEAAAGSCYSRR
eukprot:COSAG02_NODE_3308_length_6959_cov_3.565015_4_plen_176_part_00